MLLNDPDPEFRELAQRLVGSGLLRGALAVNSPRIGRYLDLELAGQGACAKVYRARDPEVGRTVAIKVLSAGAASARFEREKRALALLQHENIVEIYDAGTWDGKPYFVMEYLPQSLEDANLPLREAVRVIERVAGACAFAHRAGVIHHDLKPSNILLGDRPAVADFGVAKLQDAPRHTQTGALVGTPDYMAPEQIQGIRDEPRSDVYALGVVLYEQVCGRLPYEGETTLEVLTRIATGEFPSPRTLVPDVDPALEAIVLRAMERDLEERYDSAEALQLDLLRWLRGELEPPRRDVPSWLWAGLAMVLCVALLTFAVILGGRSTDPIARPPATQAAEEDRARARALLLEWRETQGLARTARDFEPLRKAERILSQESGAVGLALRGEVRSELGAWGLAAADLKQACAVWPGPNAELRELYARVQWEHYFVTATLQLPGVAEVREQTLEALGEASVPLRALRGWLAGSGDPLEALEGAGENLLAAQVLALVERDRHPHVERALLVRGERVRALFLNALLALSGKDWSVACTRSLEAIAIEPRSRGPYWILIRALHRAILLPDVKRLVQGADLEVLTTALSAGLPEAKIALGYAWLVAGLGDPIDREAIAQGRSWLEEATDHDATGWVAGYGLVVAHAELEDFLRAKQRLEGLRDCPAQARSTLRKWLQQRHAK